MFLGHLILRYGLVLVLLSIGLLKFTAAEAAGIHPLIASTPLLAWMYGAMNDQAASNVIGMLEIVAALGIAARPMFVRATMVGSALAVGTFLVTLSFLLTAPGAWDKAHGFPFLGGTGQFIVKDLVLLGASIWSFGDAWKASQLAHDESGQ